MRILVLGHGKTGKLVAQVAAERGHGVHVLDAKENPNAAALTAPFIAAFDMVIDFTTPEAVLSNLRACLATGAKVVVGTTGWYDALPSMKDLADRKGASLLFGTNFSFGVQAMFELAREFAKALPGYTFSIDETHHVTKLDAPSGTALTLKKAIEDLAEAEITSIRDGDAAGIHTLKATSQSDTISLTHEAHSRRGFAEGAVSAAEWLATQKPGTYDFAEIYKGLVPK
ncbi:4-hydroxy-tetrahydrodipicolinate reductase [Terriglobus saanensis]|uniref:4-hydroxy-tetrahydrodipicolinate reductase n=1 Tax=Terriglobus saanensis (strain ATCC BAA-1853 / DSM 23119 / SP1PR4) TaxID=401053 RepID=E8V751_TERSS|nr:dihydrodipicolinate reductase C-terminal domain-containing protein [Terriglobus saanensis]ADV81691.1 dihydrodipicolinate reductase [Terriglobus saanensis SP1PR4]